MVLINATYGVILGSQWLYIIYISILCYVKIGDWAKVNEYKGLRSAFKMMRQ